MDPWIRLSHVEHSGLCFLLKTLVPRQVRAATWWPFKKQTSEKLPLDWKMWDKLRLLECQNRRALIMLVQFPSSILHVKGT